MRQIAVGIIGTGWCGGIRAETCAAHPLVESVHRAEVRQERLDEVARATGARTATADYRELLDAADIEAVYISATPETTHYPMARDCLAAGKHVFLEKPIALTLAEADELIGLGRQHDRKFTVGYSQGFNPKFAYVRKSWRRSSRRDETRRWRCPSSERSTSGRPPEGCRRPRARPIFERGLPPQCWSRRRA